MGLVSLDQQSGTLPRMAQVMSETGWCLDLATSTASPHLLASQLCAAQAKLPPHAKHQSLISTDCKLLTPVPNNITC